MQIRRLARFGDPTGVGVAGSPKNSPASRLVSSLFSGDLCFLSVPAFSFRAWLSDGPRDFTFKSDNRVSQPRRGREKTKRDETRVGPQPPSLRSPCHVDFCAGGRVAVYEETASPRASGKPREFHSVQDGRFRDR